MYTKKFILPVVLIFTVLSFVACTAKSVPKAPSSKPKNEGQINSTNSTFSSGETTFSDDTINDENQSNITQDNVTENSDYPKDYLNYQNTGNLVFVRNVGTSNATKKYIQDEITVDKILDLWNSVSLKEFKGEIKPSSSLAVYSTNNDFSFSVGEKHIMFQGQNFELPSNFKNQLLKLFDDAAGKEVSANSVSKLTIYNRTTGKKKILTDNNVILDVFDFIDSGYKKEDRLETYDENIKMLFVIESEEINYQTGMPYCAVYREDGTLIVDKRCYHVSTEFYDRLRALYLDLEVDEVSF